MGISEKLLLRHSLQLLSILHLWLYLPVSLAWKCFMESTQCELVLSFSCRYYIRDGMHIPSYFHDSNSTVSQVSSPLSIGDNPIY